MIEHMCAHQMSFLDQVHEQPVLHQQHSSYTLLLQHHWVYRATNTGRAGQGGVAREGTQRVMSRGRESHSLLTECLIVCQHVHATLNI